MLKCIADSLEVCETNRSPYFWFRAENKCSTVEFLVNSDASIVSKEVMISETTTPPKVNIQLIPWTKFCVINQVLYNSMKHTQNLRLRWLYNYMHLPCLQAIWKVKHGIYPAALPDTEHLDSEVNIYTVYTISNQHLWISFTSQPIRHSVTHVTSNAN